MVGFQGRSPVEKLEVDGIVGGEGGLLKGKLYQVQLYKRFRALYQAILSRQPYWV